MLYILAVVIFVAACFFGEFIYRGFLRPIDPPTQELLRIEEHFNSLGLRGHLYPVRHGFRRSRVTAVAAFEIDGYPLPVVSTECATEVAAKEHFIRTKGFPDLGTPQRNGRLVLDLPMWGEDAAATARTVTDAFAAFRASS
jgi:hypothetical protein